MAGSRWQGMETRIGCRLVRHSLGNGELTDMPSLRPRRHSLTLPKDAATPRYDWPVSVAGIWVATVPDYHRRAAEPDRWATRVPTPKRM